MPVNAKYDTRIKSTSSITQFSAIKYLDIGELNTAIYRTFLFFDQIPTNFDKAILYLYWYYPEKKTARDITIEAYRPSKELVYDQATWKCASNTLNWTKQGGDWIDSMNYINGKAPFGSLKIPAGTYPSGYIQIDITPLMKLYASGTLNTGVLLKTKGEYRDYIAFASLEKDPDTAPKIEFIVTNEIASESPDPSQPPAGTNIIYVSGTGDSAFSCDGKDDDIQINQAITYAAKMPGSTVYLKGPFTYYISDSILLTSGVTLSGDSTAVIKLSKGLPVWGGRHSSIANCKAMLMIKGNSATDVGLQNIIIDGSQSDFYPNVKLGTSCYNMATLIGCKGLTIKNVTWKNGCNDAMMLNKCSNILINNITVNKCGHDGVYAYNVNNITVSNSYFINRTNSSCRFYNVNTGKFFSNDCTSVNSGYAGLELEGLVRNIQVYGNRFHGLKGPAIAHVNTTESAVDIHDNVYV